MQDDQKDPLLVSANDTIKVPLWLHTADSPGFLHKQSLKRYKSAENKLESLSLGCSHLPRPGTTFTLYGDQNKEK